MLTIQQMIMGHGLLRFFIVYIYNKDRTIQPLPWDTTNVVTYTHHVHHTTGGSTVESIHIHAATNHNNHNSMSDNSHESSPRSSDTCASISVLEPPPPPPPQQQQQQPLPLLSPNYQTKPELLLLTDRIQRLLPWYHSKYSNFIWCGICNAGDFLASNIAFSCSSAHFVETIKASEPITTTTIAILWKVDKLSTMEGTSILCLIFGVLLSTWGNSTTTSNDTNTLPALDAMTVSNHSTAMDDHKIMESIQTALLAICANICFGFRAIHQKKYRSTTHDQLDDVNFLCRMMQVGATFLFIPTVLLYLPMFANALIYTPSAIQFTYLGLAFVNASAYVTYK